MTTETITDTTARMGTAVDAVTVSDAARAVARQRIDAMRERQHLADRGHAVDVDADDADAVRIEGMKRMSRGAVSLTYRVGSIVAARFDVDDADLTARTLDAFARWLGGLDADDARDIIEGRKYRGTVWRIARQRAGRMGTGRGTMPRLTHGRHSPLCDPDGAVTTCVIGCPVRAVNRALRAATVSHNGAARRLNKAERDALEGTLTYERTERAPMYARWLDAFGMSAPSAGTAHPTGHRAPYVPHRDAPTVRRAPMLDAARAVLDVDTARAIGAALDATTGTTRGTFRVDWRAVAARLDADVTPRTVRDRVRRAVSMLDAVDRETVDIDGHRARESARLIGDTTPRPVVNRHRCDTTCDHGPIIDRGPWNVWREIRGHRDTCDRDTCDPRCDAFAIVGPDIAARSTDIDGAPRGTDAICRDHAAGACPVECSMRVERRGRIESIEQRYAVTQ